MLRLGLLFSIACALTACLGGGGGGDASDGGATDDAAVDPCAEQVCGAQAHCEAGECVCDDGLVRDGLDCVPEPEGDMGVLAEDVCARWRADHVEVMPEWQATGGEACDEGLVPEAAQRNGLRRLNLYRALAGLEPAQLDEGALPVVQACAVLQDALRGLTHDPQPDAPCWSEAGAQGSRESNLSGGSGLAGSVDAYVRDDGVGSLGHRRWVLDPRLRRTAFGLKQRFSCMHVFGRGEAPPVERVTWPPAGMVPVQAAAGRWSVAFFTATAADALEIALAIDGGGFTVAPFDVLEPGFGTAPVTL
ncbi:MAG: hypothetical protein KC620_24405, partial [Myxococcales bacterium]|nr:hypothetical protein [Myxococcales bacterium]